ncbi:hypothetical protein N7519_009813 [Penicillium mononematosum]|uniref:uncharacterized protein n=1 Tax=Penicillium mononematosum TaxID=268346 RepID=UPI0025480239|nr:uncharacterized protein N7519_009813 [Penicillium mononematosum]KAJ6179352.1 hypothetical protein N7519_009813 [Penicillium mononematosum]
MEVPVRESIKQVDENTWLNGAFILLHRSSGYSDTATWYDRDDDLSYTLTDAPNPAPTFVPLPRGHPNIVLVYDAGDCSDVWSIGNSAFCKVKLRVSGTTREATTLDFIRKKQPGFETPTILHQAESDGRSYLFMGRVPGRTLAEAWPTLEEKWKFHYVDAVVKICQTLEGWKGNMLGGVDGNHIPEQYLIKNGGEHNFHPESLRQTCESIGMDCSEFVFCHPDLGPGNIIVEDVPRVGSVGIIDWEIAGYYPRGWIRTKFRICSGLDIPNPMKEQHWWRREVQKSLGEHGFEDYSEKWGSWWY